MATPSRMKTLSVMQPWVEAMVLLGKPLENRERSDGKMPDLCRHRGPLLLHASKGVGTRDDFDSAVESIRGIVGESAREKIHEFAQLHVPIRGKHHGEGIWIPKPTMKRGGIVAVCEVVAHVTPDGLVWTAPSGGGTIRHLTNEEARWHNTGSFGLVLRNVRRVPQFYACAGTTWLFDTDPFLVGLKENGDPS